MTDPDYLDEDAPDEEETWEEDEEDGAVYADDGERLEADIEAMYAGFDDDDD